jgi:hypothetical protein
MDAHVMTLSPYPNEAKTAARMVTKLLGKHGYTRKDWPERCRRIFKHMGMTTRQMERDISGTAEEEMTAKEDEVALLYIVQNQARLFRDAKGVAWAEVQILVPPPAFSPPGTPSTMRYETVRVKDKAFKGWLRHQFIELQPEAGVPRVSTDFIDEIEHRALNQPIEPVYMRIGQGTTKIETGVYGWTEEDTNKADTKNARWWIDTMRLAAKAKKVAAMTTSEYGDAAVAAEKAQEANAKLDERMRNNPYPHIHPNFAKDYPELAEQYYTAPVLSSLYWDLCTPDWTVIEIDARGWRPIRKPPNLNFERKPGMLPLPMPIKGGSIDLLRPCINSRAENDFKLSVGWLLGAAYPATSYMAMTLLGDADAGKSTMTHFLRSLVDPHDPPFSTGLPPEVDGVFASALSQHILAYENVIPVPNTQSISHNMAAALSSIATGGGRQGRAKYTDYEMSQASALKPIMMNGIKPFVSQSDLAQRTLFLFLSRLTGTNKVSDTELAALYRERQPLIMGALLDAMVMGLQRYSSIKVGDLYADLSPWVPRMPFFNRWTAACEPSFGWEPGSITRAQYFGALDFAHRQLEEHALARAIRRYMAASTKPLVGMKASIENTLHVPFVINDLADIASPLRLFGIDISYGHYNDVGERLITISRIHRGASAPQGTPRIA